MEADVRLQASYDYLTSVARQKRDSGPTTCQIQSSQVCLTSAPATRSDWAFGGRGGILRKAVEHIEVSHTVSVGFRLWTHPCTRAPNHAVLSTDQRRASGGRGRLRGSSCAPTESTSASSATKINVFDIDEIKETDIPQGRLYPPPIQANLVILEQYSESDEINETDFAQGRLSSLTVSPKVKPISECPSE